MLGFFKSATARTSKSSPAAPSDWDAEYGVGVAVTVDVPSDASRLSASTVTAASTSAPTVCRALPSEAHVPQTPVEPGAIPLPESPHPAASMVPPSPVLAPGAAPSEPPSPRRAEQGEEGHAAQPYLAPGDKDARRFSFLSLPFLRSDTKLATQLERKATPRPVPARTPSHALSEGRFRGRKSRATRAFTIRALRIGSAEKRAQESATMVRSLIVGYHLDTKSTKTKVPIMTAVGQVKSQLLKPKSASKVIAQLKALTPQPTDAPPKPNVPIRAVCLNVTDEEVHDRCFSKHGTVSSASLGSLAVALQSIYVIDLLMAPNMAAGVAATAECLLASEGPAAQTILEDFQQITPQLLALRYAAGKAVMPDHKGVVVPTDRISVLTYWWGFEVGLPPPTLAFIRAAESPSSALLDLLTALSVLVEGVREILPFIRYFAQFVQMEWRSIEAADKGKGVACCATWLLPAALVPRAWDFGDAPQSSEPDPQVSPTPAIPPPPQTPVSARLSTTAPPAKASTDVPPRVSSVLSEATCTDDEVRPAISSEPPVLPELVVTSPRSVEGEPESDDTDVYTIPEEMQREGEAIVL